MSPRGDDGLDGAILVVQNGEHRFECPLPTDAFRTYNNVLTLNIETQSLTVGQAPLRVPLLVALRILLTLLIEGVVFYLFGYRQIRSWIFFFSINIITQGGLNVMLTGPGIGSYWVFGFIFAEIIIFTIESIAFPCFVKEFKKSRSVLYAIVSNAASYKITDLTHLTHLTLELRTSRPVWCVRRSDRPVDRQCKALS